MALFEKLFTKRKLESNNHNSGKRDRSSQITTEQVRLLLFKECDWRGRKVLFDSSTIEKVPANKDDKPSIRQPNEPPCIVEVVDDFCYLYKGPAADTSRLGEMIFGEVAMNCKGVSLKIHIMNEPRRLLCSKVFCVPASRKMSKVERKTSDRNSSTDLRSESNPLNVPSGKEGVSLSFSLERGDSGYYGDLPASSCSSVGSTRDYFSMFGLWDGAPDSQEDFIFHSPPGRKLSTSSNGSWQRRTFQNLATRFDHSQSANLLSVPTASSNFTSTDSQMYSNSSASGTSDSLVSTGYGAVRQQSRKNKLGLALLITVTDNCEMDVVKSCIEHSTQLQALVCRLRLATLAAGAGPGFVSTLYQAVVDAAKWLSDLVYGPRLPPLWLTLLTADSRAASKTADALLSDLCSVLSVADTKHTNFFISTLLTHVLTYHLGWVPTVSPYDTLDPLKKITGSSDEPQSPYNALWAQLSDLCGSIGFPPRAARTIICGTSNIQLVNRLLIVLTYFVRSGDVRKNDFKYEGCVLKETKVFNVNRTEMSGIKRTKTVNKFSDLKSADKLKVPEMLARDSESSVSTLVASDPSIKKCNTLANLSEKLSSSEFKEDWSSIEKPMTSQLRRNPTTALPLKASSDSSLNSSFSESEVEKNVVFVLGDNEKLVGLKNKSNGGKSVKKSSKVQNVPEKSVPDVRNDDTKGNCDENTKSPDNSRCCAQTLQHSKPIKHSGFKFEFDKYPQIVTNYMKSKNLEILDRHYIGKPGNLKLDNYQFDPTLVPPIQEERCEICYKCQQMEAMLQTPTNASEMEYMNDIPRVSEPQYAKEIIVNEPVTEREISPKTFTRQKVKNTIVVNVKRKDKEKEIKPSISFEVTKAELMRAKGMELDKLVRVKEIVEFPMPKLLATGPSNTSAGFDGSLFGGVTDHYVPDLILQGTVAKPNVWEKDLRRDLDLTCYLNKSLDAPVQAVAIIGDTNTWDVRVVGRGCGANGGMSALVASMLEPLPAMLRARVPAHQCLTFLEGKLREFCVISKTLADMLMSTDFCDIATLTKSLNIDVNDVPLLLAVATTHTPQVATRYGISYR